MFILKIDSAWLSGFLRSLKNLTHSHTVCFAQEKKEDLKETLRPFVPHRSQVGRAERFSGGASQVGSDFQNHWITRFFVITYLVGGFKHLIFHNIWDNASHWLIFFKMVKTTNQVWLIALKSLAKNTHILTGMHIQALSSRNMMTWPVVILGCPIFLGQAKLGCPRFFGAYNLGCPTCNNVRYWRM